jgi:putative proteasome-type protease
MAIASAGNLAISQSVLSTLTEGIEDPHHRRVETLMNAPTMFQAAQRIGRAIRNVHATEGEALRSEDVSFDVSFPVRRPDQGLQMRLFMVYTAGNFIECTTDTPICRSASTNTASRCSTARCITTSNCTRR